MDLYTCDAAAEAKPPMSVPMIEPARPMRDESANDVAAARPDAITAAKEKSSKTPFLPSASSGPVVLLANSNTPRERARGPPMFFNSLEY